MITVQLNLYILSYDNISKDFNIVSSDGDRLSIPNTQLTNSQDGIKQSLDILIKKYVDISDPVSYRLYNNIIIDDIYHSIYFCIIPNTTKVKDTAYKLPINNYAIHSPNIQQIMRILC